MIQKICPFCKLDSYSSYDDPNWICPYCGKNIGDSRPEATQLRKEGGIVLPKKARKKHLKVVNCQGK